jgi:dTDP-4-dehydrorhamnose reductase
MLKILVTGANGQLGSELKKASLRYPSWGFTFTDVNDLDITHLPSLEDYCAKNNFHYLINCAAYTAVDKAETEPEMATKINCQAVKNLTIASQKSNTVLFHISTDYVFDGNACEPYHEFYPTNPQSVYGQTKLMGEQEALKYNRSVIIRTSWLYSAYGNNFVKTMLRLGAERSEVKVIYNQIGSPTFAEDLALAILTMIESTEKQELQPGIYHFSNEGVCSWYDFAWEIMNYAHINCMVKPILSNEYPLPAKRPSYSVFDKNKIKKNYHIEIPYWKTSLYKCLDELNNSK